MRFTALLLILALAGCSGLEAPTLPTMDPTPAPEGEIIQTFAMEPPAEAVPATQDSCRWITTSSITYYPPPGQPRGGIWSACYAKFEIPAPGPGCWRLKQWREDTYEQNSCTGETRFVGFTADHEFQKCSGPCQHIAPSP